MITDKTIKYILFGGLIIGLLIYIGLSIFQEEILHISNNNWTSLLTITRILVATIFIFLTLQWPWVVKIFLGNAFVSGYYKGISRQAENPKNIDHIEDFYITQSLLWTRISGRTHINEGPVVANWKGILIKYDGDSEFRFAIDLQTTNGTKWGILSLRIDKKGALSGFYFPTETNEQNFISTFEAFRQPKEA